MSNHGLLTDLLRVDQQRRILVFFGHFPQSCRELSNGGIFVSILLNEFFVEELLPFELLPEIFQLIQRVRVFLFQLGLHTAHIFSDDFINIFDLFAGD